MATKGRTPKPLFTRLLSKVQINQHTDCWEWTGGKNNLGYGMVRDGEKMRTAHRVSYELHNDTTIPKLMCVCHSCDNPLCINPKHLWLGTRKQNSQDMINKGRAHFYSQSEGYISPMTGKKQPRKICPHCDKDIPHNVYARFHGDNCKLKI